MMKRWQVYDVPAAVMVVRQFAVFAHLMTGVYYCVIKRYISHCLYYHIEIISFVSCSLGFSVRGLYSRFLQHQRAEVLPAFFLTF